ncbi:hypothetical protein AB6B38_04905 [Glycocaulis abyssi]|uniref:Uncharacterized protein n=1 Tax=Glycocaulis abyssi TaxID=1433403 RepID=A0ABV9N8Y3_9PROT
MSDTHFSFEPDPASPHNARIASILDRMLEMEHALQKEQRFDPWRLVAPNAVLLAGLGVLALMAAFNSGLPIAEIQPGRMLLGVVIVAAGFGFYGVSTAQAARRRILQLEALRLQRRAMLAAQAMEHGEGSRSE